MQIFIKEQCLKWLTINQNSQIININYHKKVYNFLKNQKDIFIYLKLQKENLIKKIEVNNH